jgi:DNA-directed RNA polymerase subunit RPC12/RpoP
MPNDSSIRAFKCPTCGAPLEPQAGALTMKCNYCGGTVIIPQSMRTPPPASPSSSGIPQYNWGGLNLSEIMGEAMRLPEAISLAEQGRITEAAQLYSQITGASLTDATTAINQIVAGQAVSLVPGQSGMQWGQTPPMYGGYSGFNQPGSVQTLGTFTTGSSSSASQPGGFDFGYWIGSKLPIIIGLIVICSLVVGFGIPLLSFVPALFSTFSSANSNSSSSGSNPIATFLPQGLGSLSSSGFATQTLSFGSKGIAPGMFTDVRAIAVDSSGNIIAADYEDGRIQVFDPTGKSISTFSLGSKTIIPSLAVSPDNKIYVANGGNISIFDESGNQVGTLQKESHYFDDIAFGGDGLLYGVTEDDTIDRFNSKGNVNLEITNAFENVTGNSETIQHITADGLGNIYVAGANNYLILKYSSAGKYINQFGGENNDPGQFAQGKFVEPGQLAVDGYGRVYVSDVFTNVQVFDSTGAYVNSIPVNAYGIAIDNQNNVYVTLSDHVEKFQVQKPAGQ